MYIASQSKKINSTNTPSWNFNLITKYTQDITENQLKLLKASFVSADITILIAPKFDFNIPVTRKAVSTRMGKGIGLLVEYKVNIKKGVSLMTVSTDDLASLTKVLQTHSLGMNNKIQLSKC